MVNCSTCGSSIMGEMISRACKTIKPSGNVEYICIQCCFKSEAEVRQKVYNRITKKQETQQNLMKEMAR